MQCTTLAYAGPQVGLYPRRFDHCSVPSKHPIALLVVDGRFDVCRCAKVDSVVWCLHTLDATVIVDGREMRTMIWTADFVTRQSWPSSDH